MERKRQLTTPLLSCSSPTTSSSKIRRVEGNDDISAGEGRGDHLQASSSSHGVSRTPSYGQFKLSNKPSLIAFQPVTMVRRKPPSAQEQVVVSSQQQQQQQQQQPVSHDSKSKISPATKHDSLRSTSSSTTTTNSIDLKSQQESQQEEDNKKQHDLKSTLSSNYYPDPTTPQGKEMSPDIYVQRLFESILKFAPRTRPTLELTSYAHTIQTKSFFMPLSEDDINSYGLEVLSATRDQDLTTLRALHASGRSMSCANRFGESLLHTACRRGFTDIVTFLIEEGNVPICRTDDGGRTPFHDTLWNRDCQFTIFDLLLKREPLLLLAKDNRGFTPFAYSRREHWDTWKLFIWERKELIRDALEKDSMVVDFFRPTSSSST